MSKKESRIDNLAKVKMMLNQFKLASDILYREVEHLQNIRLNEERQKKRVLAIDAAFIKFKENGDYDVFTKAVYNLL